jgi:hypothetical protein
MKLTNCAGGCGKKFPHVEGHAMGMRPCCEECFKNGKSTEFEVFSTGGPEPGVFAVKKAPKKDKKRFVS